MSSKKPCTGGVRQQSKGMGRQMGVLGQLTLGELGSKSITKKRQNCLKKRRKQEMLGRKNLLGRLYYRGGYGLARDYFEAANWWRKAADQGKAEAQSRLGKMYLYGEGVIQNYSEADKWLRKAAEQGAGEAQYSLGELLSEKNNGNRNLGEAHVWFNLASSHGNYSAQSKRDSIATQMTARGNCGSAVKGKPVMA